MRQYEAAWHRKRAEVARLMAAGNEAAADRLLAEMGDAPDASSIDSCASKVAGRPSAGPVEPTDGDAQGKLASADIHKRGGNTSPSTNSPAVASQKTKPPMPTPTPTRSKTSRDKRSPQKKVQQKSKNLRRGFFFAWGDWIGQQPSWLWSMVVHLGIFALLATMTFASFVDPPFFLSAAINEGDLESEVMPEVSLTQLEPMELETDLLSEESLEAPLTEPLDLVSFSEPSALPADALLSGDLLGQVPDNAPGGGSKEAGEGAGKGKTKNGKVRFFGSESVADRVVFIVDNSGSMQRGRMETTLMELDRAVQSLSYSQSFYVIFYSDQVYPMFFPKPVEELLPATRENKKRLSAWLPSIEICLGGRLLDAVEFATKLNPQVVYLLSDGDIRSERVMRSLTETGAWPFTIHTLGMGARTKQHATNLAAIAQANGGGFRLTRAHPQAVLRSQQRPIPYHREKGAVWGSRVQAWK